MVPSKRTTMRSSKGTKLYAVRNADGTFKDIQTYKRAHGAEIKRKSKAETATAAAKKPAKKATKAGKKSTAVRKSTSPKKSTAKRTAA